MMPSASTGSGSQSCLLQTSGDKVLERVVTNAEHLISVHDNAQGLLNVAMRGAMPWATPLVMKGVLPSVDKLEVLCTQLLAIVMRSDPSVIQAEEKNTK